MGLDDDGGSIRLGAGGGGTKSFLTTLTDDGGAFVGGGAFIGGGTFTGGGTLVGGGALSEAVEAARTSPWEAEG